VKEFSKSVQFDDEVIVISSVKIVKMLLIISCITNQLELSIKNVKHFEFKPEGVVKNSK